MKTEKLLKYLEIIVDLEKNIQIQTKTINEINSKIQGFSNKINANTNYIAKQKALSQRSSLNASNVSVNKSGRGFAAFGVYYCGFLGAIILGGPIFLITRSALLTIILGAIGAVIGGKIPWAIWQNTLDKRRDEQINRIEDLKYEDELQAVALNAENEKLTAQIPLLRENCKAIEKAYKVTKETLDKFYSLNVIPIKYRSIIPVCMFYDYILNKRTYSLERNPVTSDIGAINMYEDEVFRNIIITKFEELNQKMNIIIENQKIFYSQMIEAQHKTNSLLETINNNIVDFHKDVSASMDVLKYQNQQIVNCQHYMAYVTYHNSY